MIEIKVPGEPQGDYISRQAVYELIGTLKMGDVRAMEKLRRGLEKLPSEALEKSEWIPCSERLPEDGDTYLVTIEYNGEVIGVDAASYSPVEGYIDKHWDTFNDWKEDDDSCYHITAWMPLPEPYKAESEEEE